MFKSLPVFNKDTVISPVKVVECSDNQKLSHGRKCSATLVAQHSCPSAANGNSVPCPFLPQLKMVKDKKTGTVREKLVGEGCYANNHFMGMKVDVLNDSAISDPTLLAKLEAEGIDALKGRFPLRLHTVGDWATPRAVEIGSAAVRRFKARSGQDVWTYAHGWRDIPAHLWEGVSVFASCHNAQDIKDAKDAGYATCIVVTEFESNKPYIIGNKVEDSASAGQHKVIPCLKQTGAKESCVDCGLCFHADKLRKSGNVIAFAVHGATSAKAAKTLEF